MSCNAEAGSQRTELCLRVLGCTLLAAGRRIHQHVLIMVVFAMLAPGVVRDSLDLDNTFGLKGGGLFLFGVAGGLALCGVGARCRILCL